MGFGLIEFKYHEQLILILDLQCKSPADLVAIPLVPTHHGIDAVTKWFALDLPALSLTVLEGTPPLAVLVILVTGADDEPALASINDQIDVPYIGHPGDACIVELDPIRPDGQYVLFQMGEELSADDLTTLEAHARQLFLRNLKFQRIQFLFPYFLHRHKNTSGTYEMFIQYTEFF
ncbi:hypothetical protein SDC9_82225 [bioreactor metagenome]|uniref:Uncharacterized protein n=1 Tax=bioreactor metagenome TaxID=1076179 RepID=A0A644Z4B0_9ZZZZ